MFNSASKQNKVEKSRKPLAIAAVVVAVLAVVLIAVLFAKDSFLYRRAQSKAERGEYSQAVSMLKNASAEKAVALRDYLELRMDISRKYPALLAEFDIEVMTEWKDSAQDISQRNKDFSKDLKEESDELSARLETICSVYYEYDEKRGDILEMMEIFNEVNRLYTDDGTGHNIGFTVAEENLKIARWEELNRSLIEFSGRIPDGDRVYLLTYLIRETQGELEDLKTAMSNITSKGYSETDNVRVSGTGRKTFPAVINSDGVSVSVASKETYESYLALGIYRALVQSLAEYYSGI